MAQSHQPHSQPEVKAQYERWAADALLSALGANDTAEFVRHGDDHHEPDIIYAIRDHSLGIEVTTAYYNTAQAVDVWDQASTLGDVLDALNHPLGVVEEADATIYRQIQHEINTKATKEYVGTIETWLCVVVQAPLTDQSNLGEAIDNLVIPESDFDAIYLLSRAVDAERYFVTKISP